MTDSAPLTIGQAVTFYTNNGDPDPDWMRRVLVRGRVVGFCTRVAVAVVKLDDGDAHLYIDAVWLVRALVPASPTPT